MVDTAQAPTAPSGFKMHGCRTIVEKTAGAVQIKNHVDAIEHQPGDNPGPIFDLSKALIDTACKTILTDKSKEVNERWDLPKLLSETLKVLPIEQSVAENRAEMRSGLRKVAQGLLSTVQAVCELRNRFGNVSHGRDAYSSGAVYIQAQFVAQAADSVVHFLFTVHKNDFKGPDRGQETYYPDNQKFNDYVDELHEPVQIFEGIYKPSRVLFDVDPIAYKSTLSDFNEQPAMDK